MKACLTAEGWKEDRRLPKGWMIKAPVLSSTEPLKFLNEEAEELDALEALEHLTLQNTSEEDIMAFKTILTAAENKIQSANKNAKMNSGPNAKKKMKSNNEEKFKKVEIIAKKLKESIDIVDEKETKIVTEIELDKYPGLVAMEKLNKGRKAIAENELEKDTRMKTEEKLKEDTEESTEKETKDSVVVVGTEDLPCSISKNLPEGWTIGNGKGAV